MNTYKATTKACYLGTINQALIMNLTAILFIPLGEQFGLSFTQLGTLVLVNFITQVLVALVFGSIVDRFGFRKFIVGAHIAGVVGMGWFAVTPWLPFPPYPMLMLGTFVFAVAGGFMELLLSPIMNALPTDEKSSAMSIMHSFFCFGHVGVVLVTTVFLFIFGRESWPIITFIWMLLPLVNGVLFAVVPLAPPAVESRSGSARQIVRQPMFIVLVAAILFAGASEMTISQWSSAFMEETMGLPKIVGDIAGVGMFAVMMGISRIGYGILKTKGVKWLPRQSRIMLMGSVLALVCYLVMATTASPALALLACALCGLGVGLLWPGTLSLSVDAFPKAGTWMFAIMAAAGNIGSAAGPQTFGIIADFDSLRAGFLFTAVFPLGAVICLFLYHRLNRN